jgi:hypothetical protein
MVMSEVSGGSHKNGLKKGINTNKKRSRRAPNFRIINTLLISSPLPLDGDHDSIPIVQRVHHQKEHKK